MFVMWIKKTVRYHLIQVRITYNKKTKISRIFKNVVKREAFSTIATKFFFNIFISEMSLQTLADCDVIEVTSNIQRFRLFFNWFQINTFLIWVWTTKPCVVMKKLCYIQSHSLRFFVLSKAHICQQVLIMQLKRTQLGA